MAAGFILRFLLVVTLAFNCAAALAEPVVIERDSTLHAKPDANAPVTANVKRGTTGDATTRQGPWLNVKTSAGAGWILSFNVRYGGGSSTTGVDASTISRLTSPRQKLNVTSTIGVRGIEKEDLQKAQFDAQQVALLEKYRANDASAKAAATAAGLRPSEIEYLK